MELQMKDRPVPEVKYNKLFINNEWCDSDSDQQLTLYDPCTEDVVAKVTDATPTDVDRAVRAARQAFHHDAPWRRMDASQRGRLLQTLAELIERDQDQLLELTVTQVGVPREYSDALYAADSFRYYSGWTDKLHGQTIPSDGPILAMTRREPIGVCAGIIPWNTPTNETGIFMAMALAAGNVVIVKPSEYAPLTALHLAALVKESGFPDGVVNVVTGGATVGKALSSHKDIDQIYFVGSSTTGAKIRSAAAESNHKQVHCEMGGKNAMVIFDDCEDLDEVINVAHENMFYNQGQNCAAPSRTYVQEKIYDKFVEKSKKLAEERVIGDPFHPDTQLGPMANQAQFDRVMKYIRIGKEEGATLVYGGDRVGDKGYFIQPTVFSNVEDSMTIAREEIFGPVQCILKFSTLDEVIDRANDSRYGLVAAIYTTDMQKATKFLQCVNVGTVYVNCYTEEGSQVPYGGCKESGFGRNNGQLGMEEFTQVKSVNFKIDFKCS